jgi:hypothetical protein
MKWKNLGSDYCSRASGERRVRLDGMSYWKKSIREETTTAGWKRREPRS